MIIAPSRNTPVTREGMAERRFAEWMEEVSQSLSPSMLLAFSQIIDVSRGDVTLTYTNGLLTQVSYTDASTKDFTYNDDGLLINIEDSASSDIAFEYSEGNLIGISYS